MNEDIQKTTEEEFKLIPLAGGQHAVSSVPKTTTDFPFFYLTKHKERLSKPIVYEGVDGEGRPMRWTATPNVGIGSPGIDAHEAWTRLVKPTWEAYRSTDNRLPNILPLGGVRQCLRAVGWGQGGWEARRLLRALNQIGATWCTADFSVPTTNLNEDGKPTFRLIKGAFSRLTIFAIGEKHLTEEELKEGKFSFDFDLADTLYIQFHPFEVAIQESQPQRYLDNTYMFSVGPAARRWYELMAGKIFGVVKNNGAFCEIFYSWYVKQHHTLNRQTKHKRIVQQMNAVVRDHIDSGFIARVEYRKILEIGKEIDFLIRYFPGEAAKQSIARVAAAINNRRRPPAGAPRIFTRRRSSANVTADGNPNRELPAERTNTERVEVSATDTEGAMESRGTERVATLTADLSQRGIFRSQAVRLLLSLSPERLESVEDYVQYWDALRESKVVTPGLLYDLIRNGDPLPVGFETRRHREDRLEVEGQRNKLARLDGEVERRYEEHRRQATERFIASLPAGEFDGRVSARQEQTAKAYGFWGERPVLSAQLAQHEVRAEIAKSMVLPSLQEFRKLELPKLLEELKLDPADVGLGVPQVQVASETNILPGALEAPPAGEKAQEPAATSPQNGSSGDV